MTSASRSHDAIRRAEEIRDELARSFEHIDTLKAKLEAAERDAELHLLLADMASFLRQVSTRNFSEGQRLQCKGLADRVRKARSA